MLKSATGIIWNSVGLLAITLGRLIVALKDPRKNSAIEEGECAIASKLKIESCCDKIGFFGWCCAVNARSKHYGRSTSSDRTQIKEVNLKPAQIILLKAFIPF